MTPAPVAAPAAAIIANVVLDMVFALFSYPAISLLIILTWKTREKACIPSAAQKSEPFLYFLPRPSRVKVADDRDRGTALLRAKRFHCTEAPGKHFFPSDQMARSREKGKARPQSVLANHSRLILHLSETFQDL